MASEVLQGKLQSKKKGASKYQCENCDANFLGKQSLDSHLKTCQQRYCSGAFGHVFTNACEHVSWFCLLHL